MSEGALESPEALNETWPSLTPEERVEAFKRLPRATAGNFFLSRTARGQALLVHAAPEWERRLLMRMLAPDDAADVLQEFPPEERDAYMHLLDDRTRLEVHALMAYAEDEAGGLMNPRFIRIRPDITCDEAISYVRRQTRDRAEIIQYLYVLDHDQKLLGVLSFRDLFAAAPTQNVTEVMRKDSETVRPDTDQEEVARLIAMLDVVALPVVDESGKMVGIVTVDDIVDVVQAEATEDIQRIGGSGALEKPYFQNSFWDMLRKRAPWLAVLFVGEMFTANAMGYFEGEIATALVLVLFIPLIISSGGNAGSQATTLIIRALALGEVRLTDWWRVVRREALTGTAMGAFLGALGFLRVLLWQLAGLRDYGPHYALIGIAVGLAVLGVVLWGTLAGSFIPLLLRRVGLDPATASAPFIATLVDVTGLVIYFSVAKVVLSGTLL
ncbi:MAG: magnesium transporter [Candidatus Thermoplasmatota archaeon]